MSEACVELETETQSTAPLSIAEVVEVQNTWQPNSVLLCGELKALGNAAEAAATAHRALSAEADAFAANVLPIVETLRSAGVTDLRGLARALNDRGVRTARGGRWHVSNVRNLLLRSTL